MFVASASRAASIASMSIARPSSLLGPLLALRGSEEKTFKTKEASKPGSKVEATSV